MSEGMKPCPFCGGDPCIVGLKEEGSRTMFIVECQKCNCQIAPFFSESRAAKEWNQRVHEPTSPFSSDKE